MWYKIVFSSVSSFGIIQKFSSPELPHNQVIYALFRLQKYLNNYI